MDLQIRTVAGHALWQTKPVDDGEDRLPHLHVEWYFGTDRTKLLVKRTKQWIGADRDLVEALIADLWCQDAYRPSGLEVCLLTEGPALMGVLTGHVFRPWHAYYVQRCAAGSHGSHSLAVLYRKLIDAAYDRSCGYGYGGQLSANADTFCCLHNMGIVTETHPERFIFRKN